MITNLDGRTIISFPWFVAPLVATAVVLYVLLGSRPQRRFALLTILGIGFGFAFVIPFGLYIRLSYVFAVMTLVAWAMTGYRPRALSDRSVQLALLFFAYSLFSMVQTFQAPYLEWRDHEGSLSGLPIRTFVQNMQLGLMIAMFVIAFDYSRDRERFRHMVRLMTVVTGVVIAYALWEVMYDLPYLNLMPPPGSFGGYRRAGSNRLGFGYAMRPHAFFGEPAWFSGFLFCAIPLLIADIRTTVRSRARTVKMVLLVGAVLILMLASSRAGVVALGACLVAALVVFRHRLPVVRTAMIAMLAVVLGAGLMTLFEWSRLRAGMGAQEVVLSEFSYRLPFERAWAVAISAFSTTTDRWASFETAFELFWKQPVFGVGLGNYPFYWEGGQIGEPTNMFLRILCELGIVGLLLFTAFVGVVLWRLWRLLAVRRHDRELSGCAGLIVVAIAGTVVIRMSFDGLTNDPIIWVLLGIGAALPHQRLRGASVAPRSQSSVVLRHSAQAGAAQRTA